MERHYSKRETRKKGKSTKYISNKEEVSKSFMENGSRLLEEAIKSCDRNQNPIRIFSQSTLQKATNNYNPELIFHNEGPYDLYKGWYEDQYITVKRFKENEIRVEDNINEIVIASQMSRHKNVLRLLGCCLETELPVLVYEFASNGYLSDYLFRKPGEEARRSLSWETKLRIGTDIANVIAYMHLSKSSPILHRGIKCYNIALDENFVAKLPGFTFSLPIPPGETVVQGVMVGTFGYLAPETGISAHFTVKSDVYSFGAVLLEMLTEKRVVGIHEMVYNTMDLDQEGAMERYLNANVVMEGNVEQVMACMALALRCVNDHSHMRPTMKKVAEELRRIQMARVTTHASNNSRISTLI